eukprot:TRINITY_DN6118_c0_g1_i3.p1 TRINITY_DN6118_c0_g1~~TRINITY_DN6118_c0_g1_i3.p1  ORF type:complete len:341 (-),score=107.19 TRINITY_DN6118_c0_g1_i3:1099-2121(-)
MDAAQLQMAAADAENAAMDGTVGGSTVLISWPHVCLGIATVGVAVLISSWQKLGLERAYVVATARATVQLAVLGYVLVPCFNHPRWWASLLIVNCMGLIAAREATARAKYVYKGLYARVWLSVVLPSILVLTGALMYIIPVEPWWAPQYFITMAGMMLNNALNAISVGHTGFLTALYEKRQCVDARLAKGATRWEAVRPLVISSMRTGLTPTLNNMRVLGLVSIPGMMTGQILGGNPPEQAARYQMIIFFLICAASSIGLLGAVDLSIEALFDAEHRLCVTSRLSRRPGGKEDILTAAFNGLWGVVKECWSKMRDRTTREYAIVRGDSWRASPATSSAVV